MNEALYTNGALFRCFNYLLLYLSDFVWGYFLISLSCSTSYCTFECGLKRSLLTHYVLFFWPSLAERGQARDAGFFVFPDLSVRTEGTYRLKLTLFEVIGANVHHCKSIFSAPFYVYTAKKFPGMEGEYMLLCIPPKFSPTSSFPPPCIVFVWFGELG